MSFDTHEENFDMRNPAHLAEYLATEPAPAACESCWQRWERKLNVGNGLGQVPMSVALCLYERPEFNADCWTCVMGFEAAVAQHLAIAEPYLSVA